MLVKFYTQHLIHSHDMYKPPLLFVTLMHINYNANMQVRELAELLAPS